MHSSDTSLSVLLPSYNWDVTQLAHQLHEQLLAAEIEFEIICFDNALDSEFTKSNNKLNELPNVTYAVNSSETGRAHNRNALAKSAKGNWLLFLDGDAGLESNQAFIQIYLDHVESGKVICGGTTYGSKPTDPSLLLRYTYGIHREQLPAKARNENQWSGFSAFSFMIERKVFLEFGFDESLSEYGHEDTLFGNELKYRCIPVLHINNPAEHLGLDSSIEFLAKSLQAIENLRDLINEGLIDEDVKMYAWYSRLRKTMMTAVIGALFNKFRKKWESNLIGPNPKLSIFDLYRLSYLCTLPIRHRTPPSKRTRFSA